MRSTLSTIEESISRLHVMRCQEESTYKIEDYFKSIPEATNNIDVDCRTKMGIWCFQVIDFCNYNRETVQISLSYLDRFLSTQQGLYARFDRSRYQLACMTAIYIAAKIHEPEVIDPKLVSILSRGLYSVDEIQAMEREMLAAIDWRVNPPTSMSFYRDFMKVLPKELRDILLFHKVPALALAQMDRAVAKYDFMTVNASMLAFCSLMNSIEVLVEDENVISEVELFLSELLAIDCNCEEVGQLKLILNANVIPECLHQSKREVPDSKANRWTVPRTISPCRISSI